MDKQWVLEMKNVHDVLWRHVRVMCYVVRDGFVLFMTCKLCSCWSFEDLRIEDINNLDICFHYELLDSTETVTELCMALAYTNAEGPSSIRI